MLGAYLGQETVELRFPARHRPHQEVDERVEALGDPERNRTIAESELFSVHEPELRKRPGAFGRDFLGRSVGATLFTSADYVQAQESWDRLPLAPAITTARTVIEKRGSRKSSPSSLIQ